MQDLILELANRINDGQGVLVLTHERPDVDALGSVAGLGWVLQAASIPFVVEVENWGYYSREFVPQSDTSTFGLQVILDVSDPSRVFGLRHNLGVFVVDHHSRESHSLDGIIDSHCCATCALLATLVQSYLDKKSSTCFLAGLLSDTGVLTYSNTTAQCLYRARLLMDKGSSWDTAYREATKICGWKQAKRIGHLLTKTQELAPRIYALVVSGDERTYMGFTDNDFTHALAIMQWIGDGRLFVTIRENPKQGYVNVSFRSRHPVEALRLARVLGGGGHRMAAAAKVKQPLDVVVRQVMEMLRQLEPESVNDILDARPEDEILADLYVGTSFLSTGVSPDVLDAMATLLLHGASAERAALLARQDIDLAAIVELGHWLIHDGQRIEPSTLMERLVSGQVDQSCQD